MTPIINKIYVLKNLKLIFPVNPYLSDIPKSFRFQSRFQGKRHIASDVDILFTKFLFVALDGLFIYAGGVMNLFSNSSGRC